MGWSLANFNFGPGRPVLGYLRSDGYLMIRLHDYPWGLLPPGKMNYPRDALYIPYRATATVSQIQDYIDKRWPVGAEDRVTRLDLLLDDA